MMLNSEHITYFGVFLSAFFMGFSHCIGMCGGIVLAQAHRALPSHLLYNLGRITTYITLGFIASLFSFKINAKASGYMLIILGILLCLFSFCYAFFPRIIAYLEPNIANLKIYHHAFSSILRSNHKLASYALGILNGLLPCGMVYYFLGLSLGTNSLIQGPLIMLCFGIGTAIPMFLLAFGASLIPRKLFFYLGALGMLALGGLNIYKGMSKLHNQTTHTQHHQHMEHNCCDHHPKED